MRTTVLALGATVSLAVPAPAQVAGAASTTSEAKIRAIVAAQVKAWNAGDAVAFSKDFAE